METIISPEHDGVRLDTFIKKEIKTIPFSALFRLLRKKRIRVNDRPVADIKTGLHAGDRLVIEEEKSTGHDTERPGDGISIIFEDEHLIVVNKPRGLAVHGGAGGEKHTLIKALRSLYPDREPFLAHRLDKYTSGVLVAAKDRDTAGKLGDAFKRPDNREIKKTYLAVVFGRAPKEGLIDKALDGQKARTRYMLLQYKSWRESGLSLLEIQTDTGRRHQIRRHLAGTGLTVAGDDEYGNWELNKHFQAEYKIKHYLLHALEIRLRHPVSEMVMSFHAPVPDELTSVFTLINTTK